MQVVDVSLMPEWLHTSWHQYGPVGRDVRQRTDEMVRIVFVGIFYHWHGLELLIDAFAMAIGHVEGLCLCLIGDGLTRPNCQAKVRDLGIASAVEFTG